MDGIDGARAEEEDNVDDCKPSARARKGFTVFVGHVPCLAETCEAGESDEVGSNVGRDEGCEVFHDWIRETVHDGFVRDLFPPLRKGAFLSGC